MYGSVDLNYPAGPIAIGGLGGSGTRIVAQIVESLGCWMGPSLNDSHDCLFYTFLFVRPDVVKISVSDLQFRFEIFEAAMTDQPMSSTKVDRILHRLSTATETHGPMAHVELLSGQVQLISARLKGRNGQTHSELWGWKEPNTHVLIDHWRRLRPQMKYIHVVRNGLDMAFSNNKNQLKNWGPLLFGTDPTDETPMAALDYWVKANQRALAIGGEMGANFHLLNYDDLCSNPGVVIDQLARFVGRQPDQQLRSRLVQAVSIPKSIGRFRDHSLDQFAKGDVDYVASLGFEAE